MAAKDNLQPRLFNVSDTPLTDVSDWADSDEGWHSSWSPHLGSEDKPIHTGTKWAAIDRSRDVLANTTPPTPDATRYYHPLALTGKQLRPYDVSLSDDEYGEVDKEQRDAAVDASEWTDSYVNGLSRIYGNSEATAKSFLDQGFTLPYRNDAEDQGSTSFVSPRPNVMTWREHILHHPDKHSYAERAAAHKGWDLHYIDTETDPVPESKAPPGLKASNIGVQEGYRMSGQTPEIHWEQGWKDDADLTPVFTPPQKPAKSLVQKSKTMKLPGMR